MPVSPPIPSPLVALAASRLPGRNVRMRSALPAAWVLLVAFLGLFCPTPARAAAPRLTGVNVVREEPGALRCFFSGRDTDGDVCTVVVQALDESGAPLGAPMAADVSAMLKDAATFGVWSHARLAPWNSGSRLRLTLQDRAGNASNGCTAAVPAYQPGPAPRVDRLGLYRCGTNGLTVTFTGTDADRNAGAFHVRLQNGSGNPLAPRVYDAGQAGRTGAFETSVQLDDIGGAAHGVFSVMDVNGNSSAPVAFTIPPLSAGRPPAVRTLRAERPRTYSVRVDFEGWDNEGDEALATLRYLNAAGQPVHLVDIDYTLVSGGQKAFFGSMELTLPGVSTVELTLRDAAGNDSGAVSVAIPAPYVPGDANGDGRVSIADAVHALRMARGAAPPVAGPLHRADVWPITGDGIVDAVDVKDILRYGTGGWKSLPRGN